MVQAVRRIRSTAAKLTRFHTQISSGHFSYDSLNNSLLEGSGDLVRWVLRCCFVNYNEQFQKFYFGVPSLG